uniref:Uncharacterized protein n=1 Tax=Trichogramma kaykai TaxID=54128 RepID=A0ABD2XHX2_9HYME
MPRSLGVDWRYFRSHFCNIIRVSYRLAASGAYVNQSIERRFNNIRRRKFNEPVMSPSRIYKPITTRLIAFVDCSLRQSRVVARQYVYVYTYCTIENQNIPDSRGTHNNIFSNEYVHDVHS